MMRSDSIDSIALHADAVAHAKVVVGRILDDQRAARIEADDDPIPRRLRLLLVDFIADHRTADRAGDGRRRVAATAADLMADQTAGDAADQRPGIERLVVGRAIDFDRLDLAVVAAK